MVTLKNQKSSWVSWVLCWEQPVPYALLGALSAKPKAADCLAGHFVCVGQFWLSEGDRGRWKSLVCRLFARKSGRNRGR